MSTKSTIAPEKSDTNAQQVHRVGLVEDHTLMREGMTLFIASVPGFRCIWAASSAKEAIAKSLGTGIGRGVSWQDIQIEHDTNGAPLVRLSGGAQSVALERGGVRVVLSLADEMDYVVAFAVLA